MPKQLSPYLANSLGIVVTDKDGDSPYAVVSQKKFTEEVQNVSDCVEKIDTIQTNMAQINENAEYIRRNTENIEQLRETIEAVRNIKADVQLVQENAARIDSNLAAIESNTANIAAASASITAAESRISELETNVSSLNDKDSELELGVQSSMALIESYAEPDGEIDQHIDSKLVDYMTTSSYTSDQANKAAAYAGLYQTKTAAGSDKAELEARLDSLDQSVSGINDNIESISETLSGKADQSSVDANANSISTLSAKADGLEERIDENAEAIDNAVSSIQSNSASISNILADVASVKTTLGQKANQSYVEEQIASTRETAAGYVSDGGIVDQKISSALESYVSSEDYSSDQEEREAAYDEKYASSSDFTSLQSTVSSNSAKISNNTAAIANNASAIASAQEDIEELKTIKANVEAVNENAEYIRQNAANLETLQETVESIQTIKADVEAVQENADRIAANLESIEENSAAVVQLQSDLEETNSAVAANTTSIASMTVSISGLSSSVAANTSAIESANGNISSLDSSVSALRADVAENAESIASVAETAAGNSSSIEELSSQVSSNAENISLTQDRVSTLENAGHLTKSSFAQGLFRLQGDTSTTPAEHTIVTQKNGKNLTAKIWNESSGGGAQFKNENAGKVSFIGVNNGDGNNEIWVQGYAKRTSDNVGTRFTLSTDGMYYTKNQGNGNYTSDDEVVVKKDIADFASSSDLENLAEKSELESLATKQELENYVETSELSSLATKSELSDYVAKNAISGLVRLSGDTSTTPAAHTIVTQKNGKNLTSKIWNETSGGGAQFKNENVGKISFIGVNNGDGDNEIWVQGYAKKTSNNVGTRFTLSTDGMYYTKNQANGSYTADDEVVVKKDIANVASTSDLSGLATESFVTEKIGEIDIPDVSEFATSSDVETAISNSGHISSNQLTGLVAVDGTNVRSAAHNIVTQKNGKNLTAKIWNESSGGGAQFKNENVGKVSFIGVNNGDGDNEIWVQGYAKSTLSNIGTRFALSTDGMYYTKNQSNGSYTANDEVVVKKDIADFATESFVNEKVGEISAPDLSGFSTSEDVETAISNSGHVSSSQLSGLVAVDGTNASSAQHKIVTKKNGKNLTAMIWNESSGGGAMFTNEDAGKKSFIGVNNGVDVTPNFWVQGYAIDTASKLGSRIELSTDGFYYTKNQTNYAYTANDEVVVKKDLAPVDAKVDSTHDAFLERIINLEMKIADLSRTNIDSVSSTAQIEYSDPSADVVISSDASVTQASTVIAKSIEVDGLDVQSAKLTFVSDGKVKLDDVSLSGSYPTSSGTQVTVTPNDYVEIRNCNFGAGGYNAVEIGLSTSSAAKSVVIDNCTFGGVLRNNAISVFAHQDDAIVKISNCTFTDVSNPLRISNRSNKKATYIFENCTFTKWEATPAYTGAVICQDYTSQNAEQAVSNNLFAPEKIRIKFVNCTGPDGNKITGDSDPSVYSGSGNSSQLIYVYVDRAGGNVAYDQNRYPEVTFA